MEQHYLMNKGNALNPIVVAGDNVALQAKSVLNMGFMNEVWLDMPF